MTSNGGVKFGYMLVGVDAVLTKNIDGTVSKKVTDGRAYMWENGAVTIYFENKDIPWQIVPAHRVVSIVGKEHG